MKYKAVEAVEPIKPHKAAKSLTWQQASGILIIDIWDARMHVGRYCIDETTHEYAYQEGDIWKKRKLEDACEFKQWGCCRKKDLVIEKREELEEVLLKIRGGGFYWDAHPLSVIDRMESYHNSNKRERAEKRRYERVKEVMDAVPERPEDMGDWIDQMETGGIDFLLQDKDSGLWCCSHCGGHHETEDLEIFGKLKDGKKATCPKCGANPVVKKRGAQRLEVRTACAIFQKMTNGAAVLRHFDVLIRYTTQERKAVWLSESVRMVFYKRDLLKSTKQRNCDLYYNQFKTRDYYCGYNSRDYGYITAVSMDNKSNPAMRSTRKEFIYPSGDITEILQGTHFEPFARTIEATAAAGLKLEYNNLLASKKGERIAEITEMLFKGRFYNLLQETAGAISAWDGRYIGPLFVLEDTIEGIFGIRDRQLINRIRENDGAYHAIMWMRWSDREHRKLSEEAFRMLMREKIQPDQMARLLKHMSPEAAINYLKRQQSEQYKGKTITQIINQYDDYMEMINKLGKDMDDAMNYKPRELKRRHDEAVHEIEARKAEIRADEMRARFPGAEEALAEVAEKLTWEDDLYLIKVPRELAEIVKEGNMLHHCAGASDRYFDRIKSRETYICFLRRKEAPEEPFYTIEVEPGGTIRQHRGAYDEEPDIENIKPHLKAWQKEIRKRMSEEDHKLAKKSKELRQANIDDLRMKNNTRVLQGLMEDFMEAEDETLEMAI